MKLYEIGIDVQDLSNYALALLGRDNGVDAYTLLSRLNVLESARRMLDNADVDLSVPKCDYIKHELELPQIGHDIATWLTEQTGRPIEDLIGCNPTEF